MTRGYFLRATKWVRAARFEKISDVRGFHRGAILDPDTHCPGVAYRCAGLFLWPFSNIIFHSGRAIVRTSMRAMIMLLIRSLIPLREIFCCFFKFLFFFFFLILRASSRSIIFIFTKYVRLIYWIGEKLKSVMIIFFSSFCFL